MNEYRTPLPPPDLGRQLVRARAGASDTFAGVPYVVVPDGLERTDLELLAPEHAVAVAVAVANQLRRYDAHAGARIDALVADGTLSAEANLSALHLAARVVDELGGRPWPAAYVVVPVEWLTSTAMREVLGPGELGPRCATAGVDGPGAFLDELDAAAWFCLLGPGHPGACGFAHALEVARIADQLGARPELDDAGELEELVGWLELDPGDEWWEENLEAPHRLRRWAGPSSSAILRRPPVAPLA